MCSKRATKTTKERTTMALSKKPPTPQSVEDYLALPYSARVVSDPTGGYVATVDELPGCVTQGETWAETGAMVRDAMAAWISAKLASGQHVPVPQDETEPARVLLRLPRNLHQDLTYAAERDGVSANQYLVYLLAKGLQQDAASKGYPAPEFFRDMEAAFVAVAKTQVTMSELLMDQQLAGYTTLLASHATATEQAAAALRPMLDRVQADATAPHQQVAASLPPMRDVEATLQGTTVAAATAIEAQIAAALQPRFDAEAAIQETIRVTSAIQEEQARAAAAVASTAATLWAGTAQSVLQQALQQEKAARRTLQEYQRLRKQLGF
ncbi:MAG: type II toxin-antitoxin system HicB family antitoxin [Dehalococcoidia bacterium]